jgi:hypothetical protein
MHSAVNQAMRAPPPDVVAASAAQQQGNNPRLQMHSMHQQPPPPAQQPLQQHWQQQQQWQPRPQSSQQQQWPQPVAAVAFAQQALQKHNAGRPHQHVMLLICSTAQKLRHKHDLDFPNSLLALILLQTMLAVPQVGCAAGVAREVK